MCGEDVAWERGQHWPSVRPGRTTSLPRRLAQTHDIGWRGNVDSVGHLCIQDAQLPCQDAFLKTITRHPPHHRNIKHTNSLEWKNVLYIKILDIGCLYIINTKDR